MPIIRILLIDDHVSARSSLAARLNQEDDLQVVGEVPCEPEAVGQVRVLYPDVILMDIRKRGDIGVLICKTLTTDPYGIPVIVLASYRDEMERVLAKAAGARAYVLKDINSGHLVTEIRAAARARRHPA